MENLFFRKKIISFSGIDGSGKSTQVDKLYKYFRKSKKKVEKIHLFGKNNTIHSKLNRNKFSYFFLRKIKKSNFLLMGFRIKFYVASIFFLFESWYIYLKLLFFNKNEIILIDRYFYDHFIKLISNEKNKPDIFLNYIRLFPKPNCRFFIDIHENISFKRKKEYNVRKLKQLRSIFLKCSSLVSAKIILNNSTKNKMFKTILKSLNF